MSDMGATKLMINCRLSCILGVGGHYQGGTSVLGWRRGIGMSLGTRRLGILVSGFCPDV